MLELINNWWTTWNLRSRYQRRLQEQVLSLIESSAGTPVAEDPGQWTLLGGSRVQPTPASRDEWRRRARELARNNPYARNILRTFESYVVGPGLRVAAVAVSATSAATPSDLIAAESTSAMTPADCPPKASCNTDVSVTDGGVSLADRVDRLWETFLTANANHFSYRELARRTWRDGEAFLRLYQQGADLPTVRFVDPEWIASTPDQPQSQGIVTDPQDVEHVLYYTRVNPAAPAEFETIPAADMLHTRFFAEANEKRGITLFAPILEPLTAFERWLDTELQARKLQASIVLWRKVHGGPQQVQQAADLAATGTGLEGSRRERYRPGSILTTSPGTELQFLQPQTNFGDAVPLGRLLLLQIAAGVGLPEFMLTADASNGNFASIMMAESPAVKLFEGEQQFFAAAVERLWRWVVTDAIERGVLPAETLTQVRPRWTFPQLVNRDRSRERLTDLKLVESNILSRAEVARRDNVDFNLMQSELRAEITP